MTSFQELQTDSHYLEAVRNLAKGYGITFKEMLEDERRSFANNMGLGVHYASVKAAEKKVRDECVYFCYQEVGEDVYQHTNGEMIHGYYRIVKTDTCYEFTLMETDMEHESWQKRIREKHVTRFPLEMMGKGTFKDIPPEKIHRS
jgi:hypothetical protein